MKYLLICLILTSMFLSSCEFVAPDISKALSETEQVELNKRQVTALERIVTALEQDKKER